MDLFRGAVFTLSVVLCGSSSLNGDDWDHFVFALEWPQSICMQMDITEQGKCVLPGDTNFWTIHGLWPTLSTSHGPNFCKEAKFNESLIMPIRDELINKWPDLYPSNKQTKLWKHEWEKHGTCAVSMEALNSELKYFSKCLDLHRSYDLLGGLSDKGFKPSDDVTYEFDEIQEAFNSVVGSPVMMMCYNSKQQAVQYLSQIEFCMDRTFTSMECPHKNRMLQTAPKRNGRSPFPLLGNRATYPQQVVRMEIQDEPSVPFVDNNSDNTKRSPSRSGLGITLHITPCVDTKPILYPIIHHD